MGSARYTVRLKSDAQQRIKAVMDKERQRNDREKRKPPTLSEILVMLIELGIEQYYEAPK